MLDVPLRAVADMAVFERERFELRLQPRAVGSRQRRQEPVRVGLIQLLAYRVPLRGPAKSA
jgi:hypothetical protein